MSELTVVFGEMHPTLGLTSRRKKPLERSGKAVLMDKAEDGFQKFEASGLKSNLVTYTPMIDVCGKASLIDKAEDWFQKLEDSGLKSIIVTYNFLLFSEGCRSKRFQLSARGWILHR